mmetsp:Transcript_27462/g.66023  ORF Transcript_27462/g.66023 Transcript_27462/m.66023 type:complete len:86 (-) Transcript_27462:1553-1810(-)
MEMLQPLPPKYWVWDLPDAVEHVAHDVGADCGHVVELDCDYTVPSYYDEVGPADVAVHNGLDFQQHADQDYDDPDCYDFLREDAV